MYLVAGLGQTGQSILRHFNRLNEACLAFDTRAALDTQALEQQFTQAQFATGQLPQAWRAQIHCVVLSPGIAKSEPWVNEFVQAGIEVIGDIELFARTAGQPIIAITGSNGKSTVTTLVGEVLTSAGYQVGVGGNIGLPALDLLADTSPEFEVFVLELSSFQLETTYSLQAKTATILNISEDHQDRYDSIEDYIEAKLSLLQMTEVIVLPEDHQHGLKDQSILTFGLNEQADFGVKTQNEVAYLCAHQQSVMPIVDMALQGKHHQLNALAVMALCDPFEVDAQHYQKVFSQFTGLPHRTQVVAHQNGILWINDSKGTNVGATITAIETLGEDLKQAQKHLILIAGGVGKGADFSDLAPVVENYVTHTLLFGEDKEQIAQCLPQEAVTQVDNLKEAIAHAALRSQLGDTVLFSPACASFDQFKNYVDRGEKFTQWVQEYLTDNTTQIQQKESVEC